MRETKVNKILQSVDFQMVLQIFDIDPNSHEMEIRDAIKELIGVNPEPTINEIMGTLMQKFGITPEKIVRPLRSLIHQEFSVGEENTLTLEEDYNQLCGQCRKPKSHLCSHLIGQERMEMYLQLGKFAEGIEYLEDIKLDKIDYLLWKYLFSSHISTDEEIQNIFVELEENIHEELDPLVLLKFKIIEMLRHIKAEDMEKVEMILRDLQVLSTRIDEENPELRQWIARSARGTIAMASFTGNPVIVTEATEGAIAMAQNAQNKYLVAKYLGILSNSLLIQNKFGQAEEYANTALRFMRELENPYGIAQVSSNVSLVYTLVGKYEQAQEILDNAFILAKENNWNEIREDIFPVLGAMHLEQGNHSDAREICEIIKDDKTSSLQLQVIGKSLEAEIFQREGDIGSAIAVLEEAMKFKVNDSLLLSISRTLDHLRNE